MMNPSKQPASGNTRSVRLPLKLAGLFAVAFAFFFVMFLAYDMLSGFAERNAMSIQANEQAKPIVIDPRLADNLAKVLALDANPNSEEVRDPFSDRGGLSGTVAAASALQAVSSSTALAATSRTGVTEARASSVPGISQGSAAPSGQAPVSPVEATRQRYETWLASIGASGDTALDPRLFAIEDLLPVGLVDGGSGKQEVMFFSEAAGKTISFPLGTVFFDGWLAELRPEGVVFSSNDERRTIRMRSWARAVKNNG